MSDFIQWAIDSDYVLSWLAYLVGVIGVLIVAWRMSTTWPIWLNVPLRVLLAAVLLTPFSIGQYAGFQAPAWIVAPFEWLVHGKEAGMGPINALLMACGIAAVALLLLFGAKQMFARLASSREQGV